MAQTRLVRAELVSRGTRACTLAIFFFTACTSSTSPTAVPECTAASVVVFGEESFYDARTEPAEMMIGLMRHTPVPPSPGGRDFQFHLDDLAVYSGNAATADPILTLAGRTVLATGKIVDLGYGPELWIDTVCPVD